MSIWDSLNDLRIKSASAVADQAQAKTYGIETRVKQLEEEVDRLTLVVMAMWELLGKSEGFYLKDLEARIQEIDLRDGELDGRMTITPAVCSDCGRSLHERRKTCMYCGTPVHSAKLK